MPLSVLILEDEPLISMDLEGTVINAGHVVAATIDTCADAELWLQRHRPDAAFVDLQLKDGLCVGAIEMLARENIPVFICSGRSYGDEELSEAMRNAIWLGKPVGSEDVMEALARFDRPAPAQRRAGLETATSSGRA